MMMMIAVNIMVMVILIIIENHGDDEYGEYEYDDKLTCQHRRGFCQNRLPVH